MEIPSGEIDDLISKTANGDMAAFEQLYKLTSKSVWAYVLSIIKNTHDAEDVLQDTYVKIFGAAGSYRSQKKPMAWILTIAKNESLARIRSQKRIDGDEPDFSMMADMLDRIESLEQRETLKAAFTVLSADETQIVMLHAVSGLKHREIAGLLDMKQNTVLSKYRRAIAKLQSELKEV